MASTKDAHKVVSSWPSSPGKSVGLQPISGKPSVAHCFADAAYLVDTINSLISLRCCATLAAQGSPAHMWEYRTIDLNDLPRKAAAVDLLNAAGAEGWEMVGIAANQIAYMKREIARPAPTSVRGSRAKVSQA
jgi:hypothetical protein